MVCTWFLCIHVYVLVLSHDHFYLYGNSELPAKSLYSSAPHTRWLIPVSHPLVWTCFHFYPLIFILRAPQVMHHDLILLWILNSIYSTSNIFTYLSRVYRMLASVTIFTLGKQESGLAGSKRPQHQGIPRPWHQHLHNISQGPARWQTDYTHSSPGSWPVEHTEPKWKLLRIH